MTVTVTVTVHLNPNPNPNPNPSPKPDPTLPTPDSPTKIGLFLVRLESTVIARRTWPGRYGEIEGGMGRCREMWEI